MAAGVPERADISTWGIAPRCRSGTRTIANEAELAPCLTVDLVVRAAELTDSDVIEALIFGEPSSEAAALAGGPERARIFGRLVMGASPFASWQATKVAELDGQIVAALQQGPAEEDFRPTLRFLWAVARGFGLRASLALLPRGLALQRVRLAAPAGAWVVREVHVDPSSRNRGIGRALLEQAEADASRRGATTLALTTRTNNPARRLYERLGYRVIDTRTDRRYKRWTGAEGRVLMVKGLPIAPSDSA